MSTCTLYVPFGAKETYASTEGWSEFANIVELEPTEVTVTIHGLDAWQMTHSVRHGPLLLLNLRSASGALRSS